MLVLVVQCLPVSYWITWASCKRVLTNAHTLINRLFCRKQWHLIANQSWLTSYNLMISTLPHPTVQLIPSSYIFLLNLLIFKWTQTNMLSHCCSLLRQYIHLHMLDQGWSPAHLWHFLRIVLKHLVLLMLILLLSMFLLLSSQTLTAIVEVFDKSIKVFVGLGIFWRDLRLKECKIDMHISLRGHVLEFFLCLDDRCWFALCEWLIAPRAIRWESVGWVSMLSSASSFLSFQSGSR